MSTEFRDRMLAFPEIPTPALRPGSSVLAAPTLRMPGAELGDLVEPVDEANTPALFGGKAIFNEMVCVGRPNIPDPAGFLKRIETVLRSARLSNNGPMNIEFERQVASITGARHCVATCNATLGLELAIAALGMHGEVIVPSFTFIATVHALWRQGIRPVFCDVDPVSHCLSADAVEAAITPRTTGILAVNLWGGVDATSPLRGIARRYGLKLLYDSAQAFSRDSAREVNNDAAVFSFHATKCINAFEGGAIVTDDGALAGRLRLMVNFGFSGEDEIRFAGTNAKMSEASAAMGLTSIAALDRIIARNLENFDAYSAGLADVPGIRILRHRRDRPHNFQYIVTEVDADSAGLTRDELVAALRLENVMARRYFHPGCHRVEPYAGRFPEAGRTLPVTEALARQVMVLPTGLSVTGVCIERITGRIASLISRAAEVRIRLPACHDLRLPDYVCAARVATDRSIFDKEKDRSLWK